jgi:plastocyanin
VRNSFRFLGILALAVAASCGGAGGDGYGGVTNPGGNNNGGNPGGTPTQTNAVTVSDNSFGPSSIQVAPGTTVTWTWSQSATTHNVTFSSGSSSQNQGGGSTFSRAFPTAGTFTYQCTIHPGMSGTVTVQ